MAVRALVMVPDPRLRQPADHVVVFDTALRDLAVDIVDTMGAARAIGLTAPHLGVARRVAIIRLAPDDEPRILVNPGIVWASPEMAAHDEGSVSMPGVREAIERPAGIRFTAQDLSGSSREHEADGFLAAVIQHEIDQLDGVFWIDRLSRLKRDRLVRRYDKARRAAQP